MTFRSRRVSGSEAKDWGMVLNCVDDSQLETTLDKLVDELAKGRKKEKILRTA